MAILCMDVYKTPFVRISMSHVKKKHYWHLAKWFQEYAKANGFTYKRCSDYHIRLMDNQTVCLDAWTTAKYYIVGTDYNRLEAGIVERQGETGRLQPYDRQKFNKFLDELFYPLDVM